MASRGPTATVLTVKFRSIFELTEDEKRIFVEMTKIHLLEGTSKWSAKVAIRGRSPVVLRLSKTLGIQAGVPSVSAQSGVIVVTPVWYIDNRWQASCCSH